MDKDRIIGKAEELAEKIKEKATELTGDEGAETEIEGPPSQVKGKLRDVLGKLKDAGRRPAEKAGEKAEPKPSESGDDADDQEQEVA